MTNSENTRAELLRRATWLLAKAEQAESLAKSILDDVAAAEKSGDWAGAESMSDDAAFSTDKAITLRNLAFEVVHEADAL